MECDESGMGWDRCVTDPVIVLACIGLGLVSHARGFKIVAEWECFAEVGEQVMFSFSLSFFLRVEEGNFLYTCHAWV